MLRDLTDSLLRVVSGRPSRRNSGELKAIRAAIAAEMKGKAAEKKEVKASAGNKKEKSKSVPKIEKKTRKRDEVEEPEEHNTSKRAKKEPETNAP